MIGFLAASLFFCDPILPDLPRADAFLEEDDVGVSRLVDRYDIFDLWSARRVCGSWRDDAGRVFLLAVLDDALPPIRNEAPRTRVEFEEMSVPLGTDDERGLARAVQALVPVTIDGPDRWLRPRQLPRTCKAVRYCEGTNEHCLVAAYLPVRSSRWQLAVWMLAEGDDRAEFREVFEEGFLRQRAWEDKVPPERERATSGPRKGPAPVERELLRRDLARALANYPAWRMTDSPELVVLDDLVGQADLVFRLTNELVAVRARYAAAVPSPLDGSNTLAVVRIYARKEAYLRAAGPELAWSAAYWCQPRREIVAYLPEDGREGLLRTLRHEGFHQYLAYAGAMILSSPWINEGYAEYFETAGEDAEQKLRAMRTFAVSDPENVSLALRRLFPMDYAEFYGGDDAARGLNYLLAWSVAHFLERGAPEVRFRPFANLTREYMKALLKTQDRRRATEAVFGGGTLDLFVSEWLKFYSDR